MLNKIFKVWTYVVQRRNLPSDDCLHAPCRSLVSLMGRSFWRRRVFLCGLCGFTCCRGVFYNVSPNIAIFLSNEFGWSPFRFPPSLCTKIEGKVIHADPVREMECYFLWSSGDRFWQVLKILNRIIHFSGEKGGNGVSKFFLTIRLHRGIFQSLFLSIGT